MSQLNATLETAPDQVKNCILKVMERKAADQPDRREYMRRTRAEILRRTQMHKHTLYRKLRNEMPVKLDELVICAEVLGVSIDQLYIKTKS